MIFRKIFLYPALALIMCLAFAACSSGPDVQDFNGKWAVDKTALNKTTSDPGENRDIEMLIKVSKDGKEAVIDLKLISNGGSKDKSLTTKCEKIGDNTYRISGEKESHTAELTFEGSDRIKFEPTGRNGNAEKTVYFNRVK